VPRLGRWRPRAAAETGSCGERLPSGCAPGDPADLPGASRNRGGPVSAASCRTGRARHPRRWLWPISAASVAASSRAWFPPWPRSGVMACAASPTRTTRARTDRGSGATSSMTALRRMERSAVARTNAGIGSCQAANLRSSSAFSSGTGQRVGTEATASRRLRCFAPGRRWTAAPPEPPRRGFRADRRGAPPGGRHCRPAACGPAIFPSVCAARREHRAGSRGLAPPRPGRSPPRPARRCRTARCRRLQRRRRVARR
jgi:hypothetical protein